MGIKNPESIKKSQQLYFIAIYIHIIAFNPIEAFILSSGYRVTLPIVILRMVWAMIPNSDNSDASVDVGLLVKREQTVTIMRGMKLTLSTNSFVAVSVATIFWLRLPHDSLLVWLSAALAVNAMRMLVVIVALQPGKLDTVPNVFLTLNWIGSLASGLAWSGLLILAHRHDLMLSPEVAFVVCGICAGAVVQGAAHNATALAFVIPVQTTFLAGLIFMSGFEGYTLAIDLVLFLLVLCRSSFAAERTYIQACRLKYEATDLASSLQSANDVAASAVTRFEYLANHDPLTGLANRNAFNQHFHKSLTDARANFREISVMLIDLDRFKAINDTFGHAAGDQVLVEVGNRLREALGTGHFAARLGGDEFAVILEHDHGEQALNQLSQAIIETIYRPIPINDRFLSVGASIGISLYPRDGYSVEDLQICADVALYAAKSGGRGLVRSFDEKLRTVTDARRVFELDLLDALKEGSLEVWFQPQVNLRNRQLCGLEGLLRWNHPNHGWVPPPEIVAAAAAIRQSEALTGFVVAASCRMVQALNMAGHDDITVSFNASPQELGRYSLADLIRRALADHDVRPERLEVEITEESMFSDERAGVDLKAVSAMGVKIAIDDFGVGYSSFGALRNLKFDCIKIDRVFVDGITSGSDDRALVQAILGVARALGVKAIAEGVETSEQVAVLASLGCHEVQGYYFARPMPPQKVLEWLGEQSNGQSYDKLMRRVSTPDDRPQTARSGTAARTG